MFANSGLMFGVEFQALNKSYKSFIFHGITQQITRQKSPLGDGVYILPMVIWGMVHSCFNHMFMIFAQHK